MIDKELDQQIHKMLDGKWNLLCGHKMAIRVFSDKGEYKKVKKRLKNIALSRGLEVKIEKSKSCTISPILHVTFEKPAPPIAK